MKVVGDEDSTTQHRGEVSGHLIEARCASCFCCRDPVDGLRAEIAVGVDQAAPLVSDAAVLVELDDCHFDDPVMPARPETSGFKVDDCVHVAPYTDTRNELPAALRSSASHRGGNGWGSPNERK